VSGDGPRDWAAHFDGLAAQAADSGDAAAQADALQRAATALTMAGDKAGAADRLGRAVELFEQLGQPRGVADSLYAQGRLLNRIDGEHARARPLFERAIAAYQALGEPLNPRAVACYQELAGSYATDQDWGAADQVLARLLPSLRADGQHGELAQLLRTRATYAQMVGQLQVAVDRLDEAIQAASAASDRALAVQLRLQRWATLHALGRDPGSMPDFASMASGFDPGGLPIDAEIERAGAALRDARARDALAHASQARFAALKDDDPVRYLLACTLVAEAHEALDDKPAVIEALLTCRATLTKRLGEPAGRALLPLLESLEGRWGKAELARARAVYRERIAARTAQA